MKYSQCRTKTDKSIYWFLVCVFMVIIGTHLTVLGIYLDNNW